MDIINQGVTIGYKCPKCGWAEVTTDADEIYDDQLIYSITLHGNGSSSNEQIRAVSKIADCNFIQAKKFLMCESAIIFEGKAFKIRENARKLAAVHLKFEISPDFRYSLD